MCLNKCSDLENWNSVLRKLGLVKISLNLIKYFLILQVIVNTEADLIAYLAMCFLFNCKVFNISGKTC